MNRKRCRGPCGRLRAITQFGVRQTYCKDCNTARRRRKLCPACGRRRALKFFYPNKLHKDGRQRLCKDCDNLDRKKRYQNPVSRDEPWRPRVPRKVCRVCLDLGHSRPATGCPGCHRPPSQDG